MKKFNIISLVAVLIFVFGFLGPVSKATAATSTLVTLGTCGTVITAGMPTGEQTDPTTYAYVFNSDPLSGDSADHKWIHVHDVPVVWDMGTATSEAYLVPSIDHDPFPGEAHEASLYGSDDPAGPWTLGTEVETFAEGPSDWISDNDTTRWTFPQPYRYVSALAGGTILDDGDAEIDAVCLAPAPVIPNTAPTANAGIDNAVSLPTNSINLNGSGSTDPDGTIASYVWTFVSGPSTVNPDDIASPTINGLIEGSYVFELTVTDDDGATATDTVTINVNPEVQARSSGGGGSSGSGRAQCVDGKDNDGDGLVDSADPGCHSDGNVNNIDSYVRSDGSEFNGGQVLGVETTGPGASTGACGIYVDKYLRKGYKNDTESVKKVQKFLNQHMDAKLMVDGIYGSKTEAAVSAFQLKHKDKILAPWKITAPTGIFYLTTQTEVNNIMCPPLNLPIPANLVNFTPNVI